MSGQQDNLRHEPIGLKSGNLPEVHLGCAKADIARTTIHDIRSANARCNAPSQCLERIDV